MSATIMRHIFKESNCSVIGSATKRGIDRATKSTLSSSVLNATKNTMMLAVNRNISLGTSKITVAMTATSCNANTIFNFVKILYMVVLSRGEYFHAFIAGKNKKQNDSYNTHYCPFLQGCGRK